MGCLTEVWEKREGFALSAHEVCEGVADGSRGELCAEVLEGGEKFWVGA